jgi:cytoskeleton-associated protein 5
LILFRRALLQALLEESILDLTDGKNIVKALNMVMIKLLDNSERTTCFIILLQQLKESIPSLDDQSQPQPLTKLTELIMKCLLKLTKIINTTIHSLQLDVILREIHLFLVAHPPSKWKDRDQTPLKTVKTLLNEIVKYRGLLFLLSLFLFLIFESKLFKRTKISLEYEFSYSHF